MIYNSQDGYLVEAVTRPAFIDNIYISFEGSTPRISAEGLQKELYAVRENFLLRNLAWPREEDWAPGDLSLEI